MTRRLFARRRAFPVATIVLAMLLGCLNYVHATAPSTPILPPNAPPAIIGFSAVDFLGTWTFEGQVQDEAPTGLIVTFGGLLEGHQTTVQDSNGYFQYTLQISGSGTVTAHTVDDYQQGSNYATANLY